MERYIIIDPWGREIYNTLSITKDGSISKIVSNDKTWDKYWQPNGWKCIKVNVTITPV